VIVKSEKGKTLLTSCKQAEQQGRNREEAGPSLTLVAVLASCDHLTASLSRRKHEFVFLDAAAPRLRRRKLGLLCKSLGQQGLQFTATPIGEIPQDSRDRFVRCSGR